MPKSKLFTLAAAAILSASAHATIVFNIQADQINTAGGTAAPTSTLILFIASTLDGGFGGITPGANTAPGSSLFADDIVLFKTDASGFGVSGVVDFTTGALNLANPLFANWTTGDPLALLWFPTLTLGATTIPGGTPYGFYSRATAANATQGWITPADPTSSYPLGFFTTNGVELSPGPSAVNAPSAGNASLVATPEPTSAALLTLGLASLASRRRRNAK